MLCVSQLWERFRPGKEPPKQLGPSRDFNIDMVPKFIMANGNLVKVVEWTSNRGGNKGFPVSRIHAMALTVRSVRARQLTMQVSCRCW